MKKGISSGFFPAAATAVFILLAGAPPVRAAYLQNVPQTLRQPDGTLFQCLASGDEFYHWLHDKDDFTIVQDPGSGYFVYAVSDESGDIVPSAFIAGRIAPALFGLKPGLRKSPAFARARRDAWRVQAIAQPIEPAPKTGLLNNLVVFIRFLGEGEFANTLSAYQTNFNAGTNSLQNYYREASYNTLTISTTFYPAPGATVISYEDGHPRDYYRIYNAVTNPSGYQGDTDRRLREHTLLMNAVNAVSAQIPGTLNIDGDLDGNVDNICFIVSGSSEGWSELLWPHMWYLYSFNVSINGKRVWSYNFQLNGSSGPGPSVLSHEMGHSLGAPDLYRYSYNGVPVGPWDLMAYNANPPQHMGAYMKSRYMGWISSIPTITTSGTYQLSPLTSSTNNCYKIVSPNSTTEYFIVEYRRKTGNFEISLPGEGLLVYRINTAASGNSGGPPDEIYIYRLNGTPSADGDYNSAVFSSGAGRTEINDSSNPSGFLSGGTPGGLNISGVGSIGSTISFTVTIGAQPPQVTSLAASPALPQTAGTPITWTATASGGIAPLQYKFYLYSPSAGWTIAQDYGTANTWTWTPAQAGQYAVQVWVRNAGSTAGYDAWKGSDYFNITAAAALGVTSLTSSPSLPQAAGTPITWTATAGGGIAPLQYKFWLYSAASGWTMTRDFSTANTWTWTPAQPDQYAIQVWVRNAGSTANYDAWKGSGYFNITGTALGVTSLTSSPGLPQAAGTPITWTALAAGGIAPLQYKFYLYSASAGWTIARDFSTANTWTWTPAQAGQYAIQVWVRSAGSTANYDAWKGSGYFDISGGAALSVTSLASSPGVPQAAGTPVTWTATASGGIGPLQYKFYLYSPSSGWTIPQDYGASNTWTWTPAQAGQYAIQVWVRNAGSTANYDAWKGSGYFNITASPPGPPPAPAAENQAARKPRP
jgi:M6 family metalloprotease-like protein